MTMLKYSTFLVIAAAQISKTATEGSGVPAVDCTCAEDHITPLITAPDFAVTAASCLMCNAEGCPDACCASIVPLAKNPCSLQYLETPAIAPYASVITGAVAGCGVVIDSSCATPVPAATCAEVRRTECEEHVHCMLEGRACTDKPEMELKPIGGEKDEHGCLASAGYSWCATLNTCLKPETQCEKVVAVVVECSAETAMLNKEIQMLESGLACKKDSECIRSYCSPNKRKCRSHKAHGDKCNMLQKCQPGLACSADGFCVEGTEVAMTAPAAPQEPQRAETPPTTAQPTAAPTISKKTVEVELIFSNSGM